MLRATAPGLTLLVTLAAATISMADSPGPPAIEARQLELRVSTHSGPMPLDLVLNGDLAGIDPIMIPYCFVRVDYEYLTPARQRIVSRDELPCVESGVPAGSSFEKKLTLKQAGTYSCRIVIRHPESRQIAGMTHEVKVYHGRAEASVTTPVGD